MRFRWLDGVKLWSAAVVAGIQHQQHRSKQLKTVETSHQQPQQVDDAALVQDPEAELERKIDLICKESLSEYVLGTGFAVAVSVDGEMKYRKAFGVKDFENFVPAEEVEDFKVMIYSVSKPFTAHCWMKFMDENGLDWKSHSLHSVLEGQLPYIGYLAIKRAGCNVADQYSVQSGTILNSDKSLESVGMKHLLTHTAGLDEEGVLGDDFTTYHSATDWFRFYKNTCLMLYDQPGVEYFYSNMGYNLVTVVLERLQRNTYRNYCWEQLVDMGMNNTTVGFTEDVLMNEITPGTAHFPSHSTLHMTRGMGHNIDMAEGAMGLVSDVDDMDRFGNISARMYKQAFLQDQSVSESEKLPLSREKTRMQHDAYRSLDMNDEEEYVGQNAGWETFREMQSVVKDRRRIKMRFGHGGLGLGSTAFLSVSFHGLDVDRADRSDDDALARQLVPGDFESGPMKPALRQQPLKCQCFTPWEMPPEVKVFQPHLMRKWAFLAGDHDYKRFNVRIEAYMYNAYILLYLMSNPPDPNFRPSSFYHHRLQRLLEKAEEWKKEQHDFYDRIQRKIFRQLIREHRKRCRKEPGALSDSDFKNLYDSVHIYKSQYQGKLLQGFDWNFNHALGKVAEEMQELDEELRHVPGSQWSDRLNVRNNQVLIQFAEAYDVRQAFNVHPKVWPQFKQTLQNKNLPLNYEGDRFAEIELDSDDDCQCEDEWSALALTYAGYVRDAADDGTGPDDRPAGREDAEEVEDLGDDGLICNEDDEEGFFYNEEEEQEQKQEEEEKEEEEQEEELVEIPEEPHVEGQEEEEELVEIPEEPGLEGQEEEEEAEEFAEMWEYEILDEVVYGERVYLNLDVERRSASVHEPLEERSEQEAQMIVPGSWWLGQDPHAPYRKKVKVSGEGRTRSVVVSIVCNQRYFDPPGLARKLDDAFAQHFFPADDDDVNNDDVDNRPGTSSSYSRNQRKRPAPF